VTTRRRLSTKQKVELFERHRGACHICGQLIQPAGQIWEVSHVVPLGLGGDDVDSNRAPAHFKCHRWQTRITDLPAIAKSKRIYAKHIGAYEPRRRLPFGRTDRLKRRISGQIVVRQTGSPWRPGA
jgi:5-methylcytosine-specific restriction protein A